VNDSHRRRQRAVRRRRRDPLKAYISRAPIARGPQTHRSNENQPAYVPGSVEELALLTDHELDMLEAVMSTLEHRLALAEQHGIPIRRRAPVRQ
jgi:hypothetical protein